MQSLWGYYAQPIHLSRFLYPRKKKTKKQEYLWGPTRFICWCLNFTISNTQYEIMKTHCITHNHHFVNLPLECGYIWKTFLVSSSPWSSVTSIHWSATSWDDKPTKKDCMFVESSNKLVYDIFWNAKIERMLHWFRKRALIVLMQSPEELRFLVGTGAQWAIMQPKCAKMGFFEFLILNIFWNFMKANTLVYMYMQYFLLK